MVINARATHTDIHNGVMFVSCSLFLLLEIVCSMLCYVRAWQHDVVARRYPRLDVETTSTFVSQYDTDFLRLLYTDNEFVVVGGRNGAYNLSLEDLKLHNKLEWVSTEAHTKLCRIKGKSDLMCHNYIRIFIRKHLHTFFVCGTNSFDPICRHYKVSRGNYVMSSKQSDGTGLCPHSPIHNSTSLYVDNQLYVGTVADFAGQYALVLRGRLRTEKWDYNALNAPDFVHSFHYGPHVYFLFRESAIEYLQCDKKVLSRISRVCRNDRGGSTGFQSSWTTFTKARLNCSVPGDPLFYFDNMQAASDVVRSPTDGDRLYVVFSTQQNAIAGSALCVFSMDEVKHAFDGPFKELSLKTSSWFSLPNDKVPSPRPGTCTNNSHSSVTDSSLDFIKRHPLMNDAVNAMFNRPLFTRVSSHYRFTAIAVDAHVPLIGGSSHDNRPMFVDVLFVGTDDGRIMKLFYTNDSNTITPVVIEEIQVLPLNRPIKRMHLSRTRNTNLLIVSDSMLVSVSLHRCYSSKTMSCRECLLLKDPYCAWNLAQSRCMHVSAHAYFDSDYVQNVFTGTSPRCGVSSSPDVLSVTSTYSTQSADTQHRLFATTLTNQTTSQHTFYDALPPLVHSRAASEAFSMRTLLASILITALLFLLLGFIGGVAFLRRVRNKNSAMNIPYADTDYTYFDQRVRAMGQGGMDEVTYTEPVLLPSSNIVSTLTKSIQHPTIAMTRTGAMFHDDVSNISQKTLTHFRSKPISDNQNESVYQRSFNSDNHPEDSGYLNSSNVRRVYL